MLTKYVAAPKFHDKLLQVGMKRAMTKIYRLSVPVVRSSCSTADTTRCRSTPPRFGPLKDTLMINICCCSQHFQPPLGYAYVQFQLAYMHVLIYGAIEFQPKNFAQLLA
jgi:hypothetical protein